MERKELAGVSRIVVKIGSSSIMRNRSAVSRDFMESIAEQTGRLMSEGKEILIVSSGAIALGMKAMKATPKPNEIPIRQAAASVGQSILMREWSECFSRHGIVVGQVLLTMDDYSVRNRAVSLNNTVESLISNRVVPIFNENDAISDYEIRFGDNDTLSAIVASRTDADLLIILSDVDGMYDSDPSVNSDAKLVPLVTDIDAVRCMAGKSVSGVGTGGMRTKLEAAEICRDAGCLMVIAASAAEDAVCRVVAGEDIGTLFLAPEGMSKKRRWIKSAHPSGTLVVDEGAGKAIVNHKSLLPVGVREVRGTFACGDVVDIVCGDEKIAKGTVAYGSSELSRIAGKRSSEITEILGHKKHDDAVLSENMVLL